MHVSPLVFSSYTSGLSSLLGSPHEHCKVAEDFEIRMGSHLLPVEQGHLRLPRHRRVCRLCHTGALGDEIEGFDGCPHG